MDKKEQQKIKAPTTRQLELMQFLFDTGISNGYDCNGQFIINKTIIKLG